MNSHKKVRFSQLSQVLPEGLFVDSHWLQQQGYSRQLISEFLQFGWLTSPVRGVYRRGSSPFAQEDWKPVVASVQTLLKIPVSVGGRSALELNDFGCNTSWSEGQEIHLYGEQSPPNWLNKLLLKRHFKFHPGNLFNSHFKEMTDESRLKHFSQHEWSLPDWSILTSTPERAILEFFEELPQNESFHQADILIEGLVNLRPQYVNELLHDCRSFKAKRLFLWFAERNKHLWFKDLEIDSIDLGSGKRMIVPGGKLISKYLITVPEEFASIK